MLGKLRRDLTVLCAVITGAILLFMSVVSLSVSERQIRAQGQAMFQSRISDLAYRLSTERVIDWTWLSQAEADGGLSLYLEHNGRPLRYSGLATGGLAGDEAAVELARTIALEQHGVSIQHRPLSAIEYRQVYFGFVHEGVSQRVAVVVIRTWEGHTALIAFGDTSGEQREILRQRWIYAGLWALCILALIGFSWWFSGRAVRPVAESRRQQSEFIAAASHELRTPLAVIRTSAAALSYEDGQNRRFAQAIERECIRTGKLVDDLLILANADAKGWTVDPAPVEVEELLQSQVDAFGPAAAEKNQALRLELPPGPLPIIPGDENRLGQTVAILLDNAVQYTPEGGTITVSTTRQAKHLRIRVADSGPGIPAEQREHIFQRFYRGDTARSSREHYGLGLSIAWEIIRLHGGKILLSDTPGGGLTADLLLPLLDRKG